MKIKKLELFGFKSFVDKTVLNFDHDVLGIVGPNGCGKSNIVDAIRWCMGEQSAKHLRGKSMEDVIFNGSESRGPNEYAEVTLTFENDRPEEMPLEFQSYAEIAVTRRLHRSGESEYLINKTQVRLKDITDLFLGTGVGTKAYSIVEQGKIGLIVSAKPEDRRMLIEEAAGITRFKSKKKQAERKMEQTEQNLFRVGDIVAEIERNLGSLKRQAAKAERFVSYREELEDLQLYEASHRYLEHTGWIRLQQSQVAHFEAASEEARASLENDEAALEILREESMAAESAVEEATRAHFEAENALRGEESAKNRTADRMLTLAQREEQAAREQAGLETERDDLMRESEEFRTQLELLEGDSATTQERLDAESARLAELVAGLDEASREAELLRTEASRVNTEIAKAEAKLEGFGRRSIEMEDRLARFDFDLGDLGEQKSELEADARRFGRELDELRESKLVTAARLVELEATQTSLRHRLVDSERALETARAEAQRLRSRRAALEEVAARLDGVGQGPKALLASKADTLVGLVAELVEAPAELTQALAGLLGAQLEHVVVRDRDAGLRLLQDLGQSKQGRAAIIPSSLRMPAETTAAPHGEGIVGPLVDLLHYAAEHEALVRRLVGHAVLVESADVGLAVQTQGGTAVTRDGTVFDASGVIHGGSGDAVATGMLDTKREIRELEGQVAEADALAEACLETHRGLRAELEDAQRQLESARKEAHDADLACMTVEKDVAKIGADLERIEKRLEQIGRDREALREQVQEALVEKQAAGAGLDSARAELEQATAQLLETEGALQQRKTEVEAQRQRHTEHKVLAASASERLLGVRGALHRLERSSEELGARALRLSNERVEVARQLGEGAAQLFLLNERIEQLRSLTTESQRTLASARTEFDSLRSRREQRDDTLRDLRKRAAELKDELARHELVLKEHQIALTHLQNGVAERFRGLELRTVVSMHHMRQPPDDSVRGRIGELSTLIERMGSVNLDAMKEHAEAEERFTFYSTQKADLESALTDLRRAIEQMNRESKRLFKETFDAVNEKFQVIFPKMFRGGRASLRLTNPDDMLETGIDILAQPPGKKLSSIELMSGGEKALTAVSLIFAIFQIKPSPFCILDEVDAPLDEANVARYNEMIREMTDSSQFILITHIKRTMQLVDVLFGVTMQESGVSRLVSVKLQGAAEKRSATPAAAVA